MKSSPMQMGVCYLNHIFGLTRPSYPCSFLIYYFDVAVFAEFIPQSELTEVELRQVEAAYALEYQTWSTISKDRRVCAMGKFSTKDNNERLKAVARSKKEKAKGKESGPSSKRKEPESVQVKKMKQSKKPRVEVEPTDVEPHRKNTIPGPVVVGLPANRGKESTLEFDPSGDTTVGSVRMQDFLEAVSKVFLKSSYEDSSPPDSNKAPAHLQQNNIGKFTNLAFHL